MRGFIKFVMMSFIVACVIQTAGAATIDYSLTNIDGDRWQYDYTITNTSTTDNLYGFSIYFNNGFYRNLALEVDSASWDEWDMGLGIWQEDWMIIFGDPFLYNDGELSALNLFTGLAPGGMLKGLSVSFDWLGVAGIPQGQKFELFDANFASLDIIGYTTDSDIPPVPEPQTFMLLGTGILCLTAYYRRSCRR